MALRFARLTRPSIRALGTGEKITEHGITAERLKDGDVRYSINLMVDGERVHRVVGRASDGVTRTQAEELVEKVRTEAREGRLSLPKGRKTHLTFEKAAADYLKRLEDSGGKNLKVKRRHLNHQLEPFFGTQRLNAITTFTVDRYKKKRKVAGAAEGTINRELTTLSHLFSMAVEWKWIATKPCKIVKYNEERGRIIVLSDGEADALLRAAIADQDPYLWLFVMFGLNTAMRHAEILGARFDQLDIENFRLHIPEAKSGSRAQPHARAGGSAQEGTGDGRRSLRLDLPIPSARSQPVRPSHPHGPAVPAGRRPGRPRFEEGDAACDAAYGHHQPGAGWSRSPDDPADQRAQDTGHGHALHPRPWASHRPCRERPGEKNPGTRGEQNA